MPDPKINSLLKFDGGTKELWQRIVDLVESAEEFIFPEKGHPIYRLLEQISDDERRAPSAWIRKAITDGGFPALALARSIRSRRRSHKERGSALGDAELEKLFELSEFSAIRRLNLFFCGVTDAGAKALAASSNGKQLFALNLTNNRIGPQGAVALVESIQLPSLRELRLGRNPIGDKGVLTIANTPLLSRLQVLDLSECGLSDLGKKALVSSRHVGDCDLIL